MFFETATAATQAAPGPTIVPPHVRAAAIARAAARPAAAPIAAPGAKPAAPIDYHQAALELVTLATVSFFPAYPQLSAVYDQAAIENISRALSPVLRKYGYDPEYLPPEAVFILAIAPLVKPTIAAVKAGRAAQPIKEHHEQTPKAQATPAADVGKPIIDTRPPASGGDYSGKTFEERFPTFNGASAPGT